MKASHPCSSTTSCRDSAPQNGSRLTRGAWRLLLLLLCGPGLMRSFVPLLGLQAAITNMASHCLSVYIRGLCILWCSSLQVGTGLALILARKLCTEVLLPIQRALWWPLTVSWGWGLQQHATLRRGAHHHVLQGLRPLKWEASLVLLSMAQWAYYSLANFHHENSKAMELLLRTILQQVAVSLLLRCLDRLWAAMQRAAQAMRGSGLQPAEWARLSCADPEDLDTVTTIPFSQSFPGPSSAALSTVTPASSSRCLMVGDKDANDQEGGWSCGATEVPISSRTSKMAFRGSSSQALALQVIATCVLIILLYIYAASLFVQILK